MPEADHTRGMPVPSSFLLTWILTVVICDVRPVLLEDLWGGCQPQVEACGGDYPTKIVVAPVSDATKVSLFT